jgi:hypothetical protein
LSTSDTEKRVNLDSRRRTGIARSSAGTWSSGGRCLGLVLTAQGAARVSLCRCRRRSHQGGVLRFVFTAAGTAASPLLHQHADVKIVSPASAIRKLCLVKRKNPRWDLEEEDDAAEKADNEEIRVFPGEPVYFIYK